MLKRKNLKTLFKGLLEIESLKTLWLDTSEIHSILNDLFPSDFKKIEHLIKTLQPIIESFFIIYSILFANEENDIDKNLKPNKAFKSLEK